MEDVYMPEIATTRSLVKNTHHDRDISYILQDANYVETGRARAPIQHRPVPLKPLPKT